MKPTAQNDFQSSRIFAQGWNAARNHSLDLQQAAAQNPYPPGAEHQRWHDGFTQALNR